jgi:hypothetical protein
MRRGLVAKKCPDYMNLQLLSDLKLSAQQYAYLRLHLNALRSSKTEEKFSEHAKAIEVRAGYILDLVLGMRSKLVDFKKRAKVKCL